jgi:hypothetical protein
MEFTCKECTRIFDNKHPLHKISSKRELCGFCFKEKDPERSYMVIEGVGSGKESISWVKHGKKDEDCYGKNDPINRHTNYTQRFQNIPKPTRRK